MKYVLVGLFYIGFAFAQMNDFPISAFHVDDTTWFTGAGADSLGLNLIWLGGNERDESVKLAKLAAANSHGLKAQLYNAVKGNQSGDWNCNELEWYGRLFWTNWEVDSSNFNKSTGNWVFDTTAQDSDAWKVTVGSSSPGHLLVGPNPATYTRTDLTYDAHFFLKTDSLGDPQVKVCSIWVKNGDIIKATKIVKVSDFSTANNYYDITLSFLNAHNTGLYYSMYWYGNRNLWVDNIETKDRYIDDVVNDVYHDTLVSIVSRYQSSPALEYYYLLDEPDIGNFRANAYLMRFIRLHSTKSGIQTTSYQWPSIYASYVDSVNPNILTIDYYPLLGAYYGSDSTPWETGVKFQERLDALCSKIGEARTVTKQHNNKPFWYICQSLGQYDTTTHTTAYNRQPTPRELRCMIWLALAYGAKGIEHFTYKTIGEGNSQHYWIDSGLTCNGMPRYPLWTAAREMNFVIKNIGSRLLSLSSDTVFKASAGIPLNCFIKDVIIWNKQDTLIQIGTFQDSSNVNDKYFIIVNRHCLPSESLEVVIELEDTLRYLYDCYTQAIITYETIIGGPITYGYRIKLQPGQGRLLRMVPFSPEFTINQNQTYANLPYVALRTKATSVLGVDSMKIWQKYIPQQETLCYATNWLPYDTSYCWYLLQGQGTNKVFIRYKIGGFSESPSYSDTIVFDKTVPTASFVINDGDTFANTPQVTLKSTASDNRSGLATHRYGNSFLKNLLKNSTFDTLAYWQADTAVFIDSLKMFKIPLQTDGNYFRQAISDDSLAQYDNDTMLLWVDLVSDSFVGTGDVKFQYVYTCKSDTVITTGASISIPQRTNALVSHYNLYTYFKYHPTPSADQLFIEGRVGIFVDAGAGNKGKLYIDNLRCDVVSPYNSYSHFETYDSLKSWALTSGNGAKKVYGQFSDGAGNETDVTFDTIIVDTTKPVRKICSPYQGQIIDSTIEIKGWAYDNADPQQHFKQYELTYQKIGDPSQAWYNVYPDSIMFNPVNPNFPPRRLGYWNTDTVTARQGDGSYKLCLTVRDSALNNRDTTINVYIDNSGGEEGMIVGFSNYVYGISAGSELYIGEIGTGKIYRYNENYQLIDTFKLVDSSGIGNPIALVHDDSNKLWIANIESHTINRFSNQGSFEYRFGGNLSIPSGIAFDNGGNIWVSDRLHHKIKKFSPEGESLFAFGEKGSALGKIDQPLGIDIYDNKLYIADSKNKRISVFDTLGDFVEVLADSAGLLLPFGIVIDSTGCFTVSDFQGNKVIEFDPWGSPLLTIDNLLDSPSGLALSQDEERIYISDTKHKRVLVYVLRSDSTSGGGPQSNNNGNIFKPMLQVMPTLVLNNMMIKIQGMKGQKVNLKVYDPTGRLVKTLWNNIVTIPNQCITWDGRDNNNRMLGEGVYFIMLDTQDLKQTRKIVLIK